MFKSIHFSNLLSSIVFLFCCITFYAQTNNAPSITAQGRQIFCPGSPINIVTDFTISDPNSATVEFFFIQISTGYQIGFDLLRLEGSYPNIVTNWNQNDGKLTLFSVNNQGILLTNLEDAVKNIIFTTSTINVSAEKTFSLSIDEANYLPLTGHFYEFVERPNILWTQARVEAETRTYFGRKGYLATLTSQEEADFVGKQASGAGWIGGSDQETEGEWKWVTGPEAGTIFWRGQISGTTPNFAFWNRGEPNNFNDEDYAHITDPDVGIFGSWNDLPNEGGTGLFIPKGYLVEYGAPGDPSLQIVASTSIYIPQITSTTNATICESGTATISATSNEGEIFWYDNPNIGTQPELARGNDLTINNITSTTQYYASIVVNGCTTLPRIPVTITLNQKPTITSVTNDIICSGAAILSAEASEGNVYWYETETSTTPIFVGDNYKTPNLTATTSYFIEANNSNCISANRTEVTAVVDNTIPSFEIAQTNYVLCKDVGSVDLETINAQGNYRYVWKKEGASLSEQTSTINVNSSGTYTVSAVSDAGCTSLEQTIVVTESEKSNLTKDDIIITDDSKNNSIQVVNLNLGSGNYDFAIDNINGIYNSSGFFQNLSTGIHTLYIRDKNGCGTQEYQFSILAYPRFFTPNGDNENDLWMIDGYDKAFYTKSNIYIYNRYGNLMYTIEQNDQGWDGNYGSKKLPENTYWFRVVLTDINGYSIEKIGNISLIR
ncbi:T9SS type B sorting domain-containing protein [Polaribacter porphyrae]|uniref:C-type lectin domain-containing protein n=1 Tax=Polaribacter porphyrae TaxID=1137780 RepID=A0A2S7WRN3_9FLAO|nr:T9SS type B sorting domain-containing protein [Polaribacter porphyrae]PQJ80263.1 hypothetical protein BTO18_14220 [Polaribacter porphyrae]